MKKTTSPKRILVIKLADIGDVLTATPALRALRQTFPNAMIDSLLTHHTAAVMQHSPLVDNVIPSDNFRVFSLKEALKPDLLREAVSTLRQIRRRGYDTVVILHHLTIWVGNWKYGAIAKASGASTVVGLVADHRKGRYLTQSVPDLGFGAKHEIDYWLDVVGLLGASSDHRNMELAVSEADIAWVDLMLTVNAIERTASTPVVIIHPGSGGFSTARRWPAADFAQVADALSTQGAQIIVVGTPTDGTDAVIDAMQTQPIDLTGQTTLHQLAALIQQADLFIGGDSGVTHVAAASDVSMVAIFGPTNAAAWGPCGERRIVLQADVPCGPCAYVDHSVGLRFGCEARTCLKLITPEAVVAVAERLLRGDTLVDEVESKLQDQPSPPAPLPLHNFALERGATPSPLQGEGWGGGGTPLTKSTPKSLTFPTADILNVNIHAITFDQTIAAIESFITDGRPHQICTVNPEFVVTAQRDAAFRRIINRAAIAFPDGNGLLKAARWLKQPALPERVAGVDVVEATAALSAQHGYRLYFLGAQPGVAEEAVTVLETRYPGMVTVGAFAGSPHAQDEDEIVAQIQAANPDVLFVAYGAPNQDKWIARNMARLPASVLIGVGGAFDFISGTSKRAPVWMQRIGLEWLHRFVQQPSRWRRIWNAVPRFLWLMWRERMQL